MQFSKTKLHMHKDWNCRKISQLTNTKANFLFKTHKSSQTHTFHTDLNETTWQANKTTQTKQLDKETKQLEQYNLTHDKDHNKHRPFIFFSSVSHFVRTCTTIPSLAFFCLMKYSNEALSLLSSFPVHQLLITCFHYHRPTSVCSMIFSSTISE